MTKRMLSLLLALVMTLSLCVPALAADEFAAEAVTEVEEQAPVAPVEPEAPEAEEPAEEPVVDEPAAEEAPEAVADEPEMVSIIPEEMADEPMLVALGVVSKEAHWELYKAVKAADAVINDVNAGKLRQSNFGGVADFTDFDFEEDDPFEAATADFLTAYEDGKEMLDAVDGAAVDYDVTTSSVKDAAAALAKYVDEDNSEYETYGLTDDVTTGTATNLDTSSVQGLMGDLPYASYGSADIKDTLKAELSESAPDVTTDSTWKMAYKASYLTELQAAIKAVNDYKGASYAEYVSVVKKIVAALALEEDASKPVESDLPALKNAISNAEAQVKNYKPDNYVLHTSKEDFEKLISDAYGLMSETLGTNGFDTATTFYDYNEAIADLTNAIRKVSVTINVEDFSMDVDKHVVLTLSVTKFDGTTEKVDGDGKQYGFAVKYGNYWLKSDAANTNKGSKTEKDVTAIANSNWEENEKYPGKWVQTLETGIEAFGYKSDDKTEHDAWATGEKLTVYFYEKKADATGDTAADYKVNSCKDKTITISEAYDGPVITKAKVMTYPSGITIPAYAAGTKDLSNDTEATISALEEAEASGMKITVTLSGDISSYENNKIIVTGTDNNEVASVSQDSSDTDVELDDLEDVYLVGGDTNKVTLKVATADDPKEDDYVTRDPVVALTVDPLSKWDQVSAINKWLTAAGKLDPANYDKVTTTRNDVKDVATAFTVIKKDIGLINDNLTSAKVANSAYNQEKVAGLLADLIEVCGYLNKKTTDLTKMYELLEQAEELLDEGDEEYTFDSYYNLKDIVADGDDYDGDSFQTEVDAYVAKLQAAIKGLAKEGEVDKTALNASITAAEALKKEDYTEESWTANEAAIKAALEAAKTVAANADATQSMVDAAKATLDAAVAKLEKVGGEDEPPVDNHPAPAGGTGWSYDKTTGEYYFYKNGKLVADYWVGKVDGASQWAGNWYYVGADGKLLTGMQYVDDLHGGKAWYFLQPTDTNGEIGKMLTGFQWVGGEYGECYFSNKNGESGKCTWSELKGDWNGTAFVK